MKNRFASKTKGFTLIELLIAIAIMGILMAIAVPNYNEYMIKATRSSAQQFLLDIAQRQEQYLLDNRQYATNLINDPGGLRLGPDIDAAMAKYTDVSTHYNAPDLTGVDNLATPPAFVILLKPKAGRMANDGDLIINNRLLKWREKDANKTYNAGTDYQW
jgi:type IV pilus assembly protein PilE